MNNLNILNKIKIYCVGNMESGDGRTWRAQVKKELEKMSIIPLDPYEKPFIDNFDESESARKILLQWRKEEKYNLVAERMKSIRHSDLNLVDRADAIFAYLDLDILSVGSYEEIFWGNRLKKPLFIVIKQLKKNAPLWLFGTVPHSCIFSSIEEAIDNIKKIDSGEIPLDPKRWRLMRSEYR